MVYYFFPPKWLLRFVTNSIIHLIVPYFLDFHVLHCKFDLRFDPTMLYSHSILEKWVRRDLIWVGFGEGSTNLHWAHRASVWLLESNLNVSSIKFYFRFPIPIFSSHQYDFDLNKRIRIKWSSTTKLFLVVLNFSIIPVLCSVLFSIFLVKNIKNYVFSVWLKWVRLRLDQSQRSNNFRGGKCS